MSIQQDTQVKQNHQEAKEKEGFET